MTNILNENVPTIPESLNKDNKNYRFYDFVKDNMYLEWNLVKICRNPNFQIDELMEIYKYNIYYNQFICDNKNFKFEYVFKNYDNLNYEALSANPNITLDMVKKHKYIRWVMEGLVENPNMTFDFLITDDQDHTAQNISEFIDPDINSAHLYDSMQQVTKNLNIPMTEVIKYSKQENNYIDILKFVSRIDFYLDEHTDPHIIDLTL
jgi:hypothetical protein